MTIYHERILDHYRHPRHAGSLSHATDTHAGKNASCGDSIEISAIITDDILIEMAHDSQGCAISIAASSLLAEKVTGMRTDDIMKLQATDITDLLGTDLSPARTKCALLALESLQALIAKRSV